MAPAIAAAAAVAGLARWVRARGPCRPTKLRLEVETERCPGPTVSPLAARHIEHPRLAPFETGVDENPVEPFSDGLALDRFRSRHDPGPNARRHLSTTRDFSCGAQIAQPAI